MLFILKKKNQKKGNLAIVSDIWKVSPTDFIKHVEKTPAVLVRIHVCLLDSSGASEGLLNIYWNSTCSVHIWPQGRTIAINTMIILQLLLLLLVWVFSIQWRFILLKTILKRLVACLRRTFEIKELPVTRKTVRVNNIFRHYFILFYFRPGK